LPFRSAFVKRRARAGCVCLFFVATCVFALRIFAVAVSTPANSSEIHLPSGVAIVVDGVKSAGEWDDATITQFPVAPGWNVRVFAKHDAQYIYFDFEGVTHGGSRLSPEILLDPRETQSVAWQKGLWWLHVSNSLCEGNGAPNIYEKKGKSQCAQRKTGWDANHPPDVGTEIIEAKISFAKLGVAYSPSMKIGLAVDVTDATGKARQKTYCWPASAKIDSPKTWGSQSSNRRRA
jgi:hypothetical protein